MSILAFVFSYGMNSVLGQVLSLSFVTHLMMAELDTPENAILFYSIIFEWITFDLLPTDLIYGLFLNFENDTPYSDKADEVGYGSRFIIPNSGSVTIYIAAITIM